MNKVELDAINSIVNLNLEMISEEGGVENKVASLRPKKEEENKSSTLDSQQPQRPREKENIQQRRQEVIQTSSPSSKEVQSLSEPYRSIATVIERYSQLMLQAVTPGKNTTLDDVTNYLNKNKKVLDKVLASDRLLTLTNAVAGRLPDVRSTTRNK